MYVVDIGESAARGPALLLVEDNPADAKLTAKALGAAGWTGRLVVTSDGIDALEFLRRRGPHALAPRPRLVLLDLNLPGLSGREVLAALKADEELRHVPVIVLSTSEASRDVREAYGLQANAYISKPADFSRFEAVARALTTFWLDAAALP